MLAVPWLPRDVVYAGACRAARPRRRGARAARRLRHTYPSLQASAVAAAALTRRRRRCNKRKTKTAPHSFPPGAFRDNVVAFLAEFGTPDEGAPPAPGLRAWSVALRVPDTTVRLSVAFFRFALFSRLRCARAARCGCFAACAHSSACACAAAAQRKRKRKQARAHTRATAPAHVATTPHVPLPPLPLSFSPFPQGPSGEHTLRVYEESVLHSGRTHCDACRCIGARLRLHHPSFIC
jgi:hypothetical protein